MNANIIEISSFNNKKISVIDKQLIVKGNQLIYYSSKYLTFLTSVIPDSKSYYITIFNGNDLGGIMPLIVKKCKGIIVVNSQPFFGSYGGPLILENDNNGKIERTILLKYLEFCNSINANVFNFIENPLQPLATQNIEELGFELIDHRIGQVTIFPALNHNIGESLFAMFHYKTRNMVRKGEKTNMRIELKQDNDSYNWLFEEHSKSIIKLGGLPKPKEVFYELKSTFKNDCQLFLGYVKDKPVCGILVLVYAQTIEYFTPVISEDYRESQALSFLIYRVMHDFVQSGYKQWNWGGTWISQEGVYRFKKRWGAEDYPYRYYGKKGVIKENFPNIEEMKEDFPYFYLLKF